MGDIYAEVLARHGVARGGHPAADVRRVFPVVWKELDCLTPPGATASPRFRAGRAASGRGLVERLCELLETPRSRAVRRRRALPPLRAPRRRGWSIPTWFPALEALRALGLRLAVISNFDERLPELLSGLDLARRVDLVVTSAELGIAKPNPAIFRHAARSSRRRAGRRAARRRRAARGRRGSAGGGHGGAPARPLRARAAGAPTAVARDLLERRARERALRRPTRRRARAVGYSRRTGGVFRPFDEDLDQRRVRHPRDAVHRHARRRRPLDQPRDRHPPGHPEPYLRQILALARQAPADPVEPRPAGRAHAGARRRRRSRSTTSCTRSRVRSPRSTRSWRSPARSTSARATASSARCSSTSSARSRPSSSARASPTW